MKQAEKGGTSTYVDGFAVAERLRLEHPDAFAFLSRTSVSYQCFDEGCHYMAEGPVFKLGTRGQVVQVTCVLQCFQDDCIWRFVVRC